MKAPAEKREITKIDVVTAQVREAVRLFFFERDVIVIHTVIASAHQIRFDLAARAGVQSAVKNTAALRDVEVQEFLRGLNYPYNFFKHADRDADRIIDIGPLYRLTADFILDAVIMLQELTVNIPAEAKVFWAWFVSHYHEEFDNLPADGPIARMQELDLGSMPFSEIAAFLDFAEFTAFASPAGIAQT